ncbi:uncharacterized protein [Nicotiana sylvestris]|uniref:uncharacterized protein n=1 Tax=Nicotiana sylvestris TaxID=4096 RepID=UPI00388CB16E
MELTGGDQLDDVDDINATNDDPQETDIAEISFHAILGHSVGTTMKLQGNGGIIRCNKVCRNLQIQLPGLTITQDHYPFVVGGVDLVFGIKWLASLNTIQANWKDMFIIFNWQGKRYKLQGVRSANFTVASLQSFNKLSENPGNPIQTLLDEFQSVFSKSTSLPPFRTYSHAIPLLPDSKPPNIRPYRYPHSQKTEIENQVVALLDSGFIRLSSISFTSPVLLVKRKELTKKDAFHWNAKVEEVFQHLKRILTSVPALHLPDFTQQFIVECDASSDGVWAILLQQYHHIAYFSKGFSFSNRIKSTYDRELLALVLALQKWKHYLLGRHFIITTDHYNLKYLLNQQSESENKGADALSLRPQHADFFTLVMPIPLNFSDLREEIEADPYTKQIRDQLSSDPSTHPDFLLSANHLYYKSRLVIPDYPELKAKILAEAHDSPTGGHVRYLKTLKRVSANFFWPCLKHDVKLFVQNCLICQQHKYETLAPAGLLQPLPIPNRVWEDISLDFIVGLPPSNGFDTILVVVDRFSKYNHFLALYHPFTAKTVAGVLCKEIVRLHGLPRSILSDRDVVFSTARGARSDVLARTKFQSLEGTIQDEISIDSKRRDLSFNVGDAVFLRLQPYRQKSLAKRPNEKLSRYFGPYKIVRKVGPVSYEVQLPQTSKVHPIFHVSLLRPTLGCSDVTSPPPLPLLGELELMLESEKVLSHRWVKESRVSTLELLIQWRHRSIEEASWEDYDLLAVQFPSFWLEDKLLKCISDETVNQQLLLGTAPAV